jgi:hypothetical protein
MLVYDSMEQDRVFSFFFFPIVWKASRLSEKHDIRNISDFNTEALLFLRSLTVTNLEIELLIVNYILCEIVKFELCVLDFEKNILQVV